MAKEAKDSQDVLGRELKVFLLRSYTRVVCI